ncbi:MAG: LysM peptidoglycan-binding domain-containing protein, partial [Clostridiaceae bacterium]|nr:LysM peptidoglycan-binding domain-containing protein [Clostridiaceae bacterium]
EMMPDDQSGSRGSTDRTSASAGREQMDEMLVWSEQMQKKASCGQTDNASSEMWEKYVVQPGDTLGELLQKMKGSEEAFWERNNPQGIYLLPGVAYFIPGSCTSDQ